MVHRSRMVAAASTRSRAGRARAGSRPPRRAASRSSAPPVGLGQLAGAVVELGVADLAVLGVARGLELGDRVGRSCSASACGATAPRRSGPVTNHDHGDASSRMTRIGARTSTSSTLGHALSARPSSLGDARARSRARGPAARRAAGAGHSAIRPPKKTISAPSQIHVTIGETISRKLTARGASEPRGQPVIARSRWRTGRQGCGSAGTLAARDMICDSPAANSRSPLRDQRLQRARCRAASPPRCRAAIPASQADLARRLAVEEAADDARASGPATG